MTVIRRRRGTMGVKAGGGAADTWRTGLIGEWEFSNGAAGTDGSAYGQTMTFANGDGAATNSATGKVAYCETFTGTCGSAATGGGYGYFTPNAVFNIGTGGFHCCWWQNDASRQSSCVAWGALYNGTYYPGYMSWDADNSRWASVEIFSTGAGCVLTPPATGNWYFVEVGRSGNGASQGYASINRAADTTFTSEINVAAAPATWYIASHVHTTLIGKYTTCCSTDQLRFWSRALTTAERDYVYNGGTGR
jgi:hypothetical protein